MTSADLAALQLPNGGFASTVVFREGQQQDCNGFTSALVLRVTRHVPDEPTVATVRRGALRHVSSCASSQVTGAFSFWPPDARPTWGTSVPADADDTALILTELLRHRHITRHDVVRRFCAALLPHRVGERDRATLPPWVSAGCFYTWLGEVEGINLVDCCVNANVAALMAMADAHHLPGYLAAVHTVAHGVHWAGRDRRRLSAITPFYPSLFSLVEAVEHAADAGVRELRDVLPTLRGLVAGGPHTPDGCCRSAYGSTVWHCNALDVAREVAAGSRRDTSQIVHIATP